MAEEGAAPLHIRVKTLDNQSHALEVDPEATVLRLKELVRDATAVEEPRQRLIYRGRVLRDADPLAAYQLEDGHTVHMVSRPEGAPERRGVERSRSEGSALDHSPPPPADDVPLSLRRVVSSMLSRPRPASVPAPGPESLEHVRQGLMTIDTLLSRSPSDDGEEETKAEGAEGEAVPTFFEGMWLDVLDTVGQWLEATVMRVSPTAVFVHFNGWEQRWDEWIEVASPRLAPFRTMTTPSAQRAAANMRDGRPPPSYLSPCPDTWLAAPPDTGDDADVGGALAEALAVMGRLQPQLEALTVLGSGSGAAVSWREPVGRPSASVEDEQLAAMAAGVAPLLDRFGRVLADLAPHLARVGAAAAPAAAPAPVPAPAMAAAAAEEEQEEEVEEAAADVEAEGAAGAGAAPEPHTPSPARSPALADVSSPSDPPQAPFSMLIRNPPRRDTRGFGNIDVHIHAIMTPPPRGNRARAASDDAPNTEPRARRLGGLLDSLVAPLMPRGAEGARLDMENEDRPDVLDVAAGAGAEAGGEAGAEAEAEADPEIGGEGTPAQQASSLLSRMRRSFSLRARNRPAPAPPAPPPAQVDEGDAPWGEPPRRRLSWRRR